MDILDKLGTIICFISSSLMLIDVIFSKRIEQLLKYYRIPIEKTLDVCVLGIIFGLILISLH
jgi:hypothetical protein